MSHVKRTLDDLPLPRWVSRPMEIEAPKPPCPIIIQPGEADAESGMRNESPYPLTIYPPKGLGANDYVIDEPSERAIEALAAQLFILELQSDKQTGPWWHQLPAEVQIEYRRKATLQFADWERQPLVVRDAGQHYARTWNRECVVCGHKWCGTDLDGCPVCHN